MVVAAVVVVDVVVRLFCTVGCGIVVVDFFFFVVVVVGCFRCIFFCLLPPLWPYTQNRGSMPAASTTTCYCVLLVMNKPTSKSLFDVR